MKNKRVKRKANPWVLHVKQYSDDHGITLKQAMREASSTYRPPQARYGGIIRGRYFGGCKDQPTFEYDRKSFLPDEWIFKIENVNKISSRWTPFDATRDIYIGKTVSVDNTSLYPNRSTAFKVMWKTKDGHCRGLLNDVSLEEVKELIENGTVRGETMFDMENATYLTQVDVDGKGVPGAYPTKIKKENLLKK